MKRFIALVLSLVMTLSLCAPAWATEDVESAATGGAATELPEAVNGEITLTEDVTLAKPFEVAAGETVTLNLGGKTLSYTSTEAKASCAINNKGTLTITNGTVTYLGVGDASFGYGTNTINNTGKLTIDGASIVNTTPSGSSVAIDCSAGAELLVKSGEIKSEKNAIRLCPFSSAAINCTIDGGTITGARAIQIQLPSNNPADAPDVNLTVNDGTLNGTGGYSIYSYSSGQSFVNVDVTLNGGTYNNDVAFGGGSKATVENVTITGGTFNGYLGRYLADDGWEDIAKPVYVASVAGKDYTSLQDAVDVGGTVTLLGPVDLENRVEIKKDVVIEGNGNTIFGADAVVFNICKGVTVTLNNTNIDGKQNGVQMGHSESGTTGSSLTVNGGEITVAKAGILSYGNGNTANKIVLDGVELNSSYWGVYHNGNNYGADVTIEDSVINDTNSLGAGVFLSGSAAWAAEKMNVLKISSSTISAKTPVEVKRGNVEVDAATLTSTASTTALQNNVSGGCSCGGYAIILTNCGTDTAPEATVGTVTINSGNFTGAIGIKDAASATVVAGNTEEATITINGGYFNTDPSAYCAEGLTGVASDKTGYLYMVGEKKATAAEVKPADPEVEVNEKLTGDNKTAADAIAATGGVTLDNAALNAVAKDVANENKTTVTEDHVDKLNDMAGNSTITKDDVVIVVQPYFDVAVNDVEIVEDSTTGDVTSASIELDITPMYQKVATTEDVANDDATEIKTEGNDKNAVAIGVPQKMTITEPVEITVQIPEAMADLAIDKNGDKILYVTHVTDAGVSYVYEAKVTDDNGVYFATFTNPHGFSTFIISAVDDTVATVNGVDNYTNLQDAIDNMGKDATIVVKKSGLSAVVKGEVTFKVVTEDGVTDPIITAGSGYTLTKKNLDGGGVEYTVTKITYPGGYYPYNPAPSTKPIQSADTFDAGIALYVGMSVIGAVGTVVIGKKRED